LSGHYHPDWLSSYIGGPKPGAVHAESGEADDEGDDTPAIKRGLSIFIEEPSLKVPDELEFEKSKVAKSVNQQQVNSASWVWRYNEFICCCQVLKLIPIL